jgi:hypothetical protein
MLTGSQIGDAQRPGIAEVQEIEFRPPRLTDAE